MRGQTRSESTPDDSGRITSLGTKKRNSKWRFPSQKTLSEIAKHKTSFSVQNEKKEDGNDDEREHKSLAADEQSRRYFIGKFESGWIGGCRV